MTNHSVKKCYSQILGKDLSKGSTETAFVCQRLWRQSVNRAGRLALRSTEQGRGASSWFQDQSLGSGSRYEQGKRHDILSWKEIGRRCQKSEPWKGLPSQSAGLQQGRRRPHVQSYTHIPNGRLFALQKFRLYSPVELCLSTARYSFDNWQLHSMLNNKKYCLRPLNESSIF